MAIEILTRLTAIGILVLAAAIVISCIRENHRRNG
jgi:hypothetical protein